MARPRRLYINSKGKYYYIVNGVKKFIKVPQGMSQQQIQNINIKNIIPGPAKRLKRRTKKIVPVYSKKIAKGEDMEKSVIKAESGLPTYIFTPQKKFLSLGDLSTKSDDTSTDKLINLLKGAIPVIAEGAKKLALPAPEQKFMLGDADKELINDMIDDKIFQLSDVENKGTIALPPPINIPPISPGASDTSTLLGSEATTSTKKSGQVQKIREYGIEALANYIDKNFDLEKGTPLLRDVIDLYEKQKDPRKPAQFKLITEQKFKAAIKKLVTQGKIKVSGSGADNGDDGLYNDQIEKIMKKRIRNFVPVVASDKVNDLLQYVNKGDKFFSAVINTEPSESFGRHWRCIVIDNRDDYPSAEYFDSLAENAKPDDALLSVMRKIAKRMNPEKYFKFKYNMLRRQSFNTSNCSYHVMKFIEDRHNGIPFEDASGWSDYMKRQKGNGYDAIDDSQDGEGDLEKYQNKIKKLFKSYL
jgi:hypothetical protein